MRTQTLGPIAIADHGNHATVAFGYDSQTQVALKETFGPQNVAWDKATQVWGVRYTGTNDWTKVERFAKDALPRLNEVSQSRKNAEAFAAQSDNATRFPGLRVEARSGRLAVFMPNVQDGTAALKEAGFKWIPAGEANDRKSGEVIKTGGYWGALLPDGKDVTPALTIAAGAMARHARESSFAADIKPTHAGMHLTTQGPTLFVHTANDRQVNDMLKDAGFAWDKKNDAYALTVNAANTGKIEQTLSTVAKHFDGMIVAPTLDHPGLTQRALDAGLNVPATPSSEQEIAHFKAAASFVDRAFPATERQDLASLKPGEHTQSASPRLAGLSAETFGQVAKMVDHVQNVGVARQASMVQAAQAEIAKSQSQTVAQGHGHGRG